MRTLIKLALLTAAICPEVASAAEVARPVGLYSAVDEARCALLANKLGSTETDPQKQLTAGLTEAFFLGRLENRPAAQVRTAAEAARAGVTEDNAQSKFDDCIAVAKGAEDRFRALGR